MSSMICQVIETAGESSSVSDGKGKFHQKYFLTNSKHNHIFIALQIT